MKKQKYVSPDTVFWDMSVADSVKFLTMIIPTVICGMSLGELIFGIFESESALFGRGIGALGGYLGGYLVVWYSYINEKYESKGIEIRR